MALTEDQLHFFRENGFVAIPGFASTEQCSAMKQRMAELLKDFDPATAAASVFSTKNQAKLTNEYFLHSARQISFFFEEKAFDTDGNLKQPKELSINKVGHALHDLDPTFRSFSRSPAVASLLRSIGFKQPLPLQSMYIFKQPGIGGEVVPHQDSTFLFTQPASCHGLWLALEDADESNGCLWALPGSHKEPVARRFLLKEGAVTFDAPPPSYHLPSFVPLPVKAGTLVLLHGAAVHYSSENKSPLSRHAYSIHVIEGKDCNYPADNWLQCHLPQDRPFEPLNCDIATT